MQKKTKQARIDKRNRVNKKKIREVLKPGFLDVSKFAKRLSSLLILLSPGLVSLLSSLSSLFFSLFFPFTFSSLLSPAQCLRPRLLPLLQLLSRSRLQRHSQALKLSSSEPAPTSREVRCSRIAPVQQHSAAGPPLSPSPHHHLSFLVSLLRILFSPPCLLGFLFLLFSSSHFLFSHSFPRFSPHSGSAFSPYHFLFVFCFCLCPHGLPAFWFFSVCLLSFLSVSRHQLMCFVFFRFSFVSLPPLFVFPFLFVNLPVPFFLPRSLSFPCFLGSVSFVF